MAEACCSDTQDKGKGKEKEKEKEEGSSAIGNGARLLLLCEWPSFLRCWLFLSGAEHEG